MKTHYQKNCRAWVVADYRERWMPHKSDFLPPTLHFPGRIVLNGNNEYMRNKIVANTHTNYLLFEDKDIAVQERHVVSPEIGQLDRLFQLLIRYLKKKNGLSQQNLNKVKLVCEEIFVNIVNYSRTEKEIIMLLGHSDSSLYVQFIDDGIPFDPLTHAPAPIFGEDLDDINIGGLGIMMIKENSEEAHYTRKNNQNNFLVSIKC